jgi:cation:H+ antiporter
MHQEHHQRTHLQHRLSSHSDSASHYHPAMAAVLHFLLGLVMLLIGGRLLVTAAVALAQRLGVPPLLIGLTVVAWGTSAPELAFNLTSAIMGKPDLVVGNVVGANICNLGLVLGVASLIFPLAVSAPVVKLEVPLMVAMFLLLLGFSQAVWLERPLDGRVIPILLLLAFAAYSWWVIRAGLRERRANRELARQTVQSGLMTPTLPLWLSVLILLGGLALLGVGGSFASGAASSIAIKLGMSQRVVGLTIVSFGTTMPELITSILAVRKKQVDLAVGNAVGSCLFNLGAIFAICELVAPSKIPPGATPSIVAMTFLGFLLIPMSRTSGKIVRIEGALLIGVQLSFISYEIWRTRAG